MEQRIGSSSQPLEGAGFDPAFVPGLTSPVSGEQKDTEPEAVVATATDEPAAEEKPEPEASEEGAGAEGDSEAEEDPEGPVFEAADRRARIVADHRGVRLSLDDQSCEFRWDEIGAVETESPRFGKRFTITVHTPDRRWYPIEIEATSRASFAEWDEQLDAVMDEYFEDETPEAEQDAPEDTATDTEDD
ncbi:hypothetical protein [Streptomyces sp. SID13726]|uniref:hypothetical protein n=1 Tax=Streptomyces sp. SID13726 TaxID=2706058 RepID=UPI0013B93A22|nr:hypothetical protein [Streptomyces sp. SID13726]